ncbi:MAG: tetratricopeptide repeat protein [Opitutaceae bacterium]
MKGLFIGLIACFTLLANSLSGHGSVHEILAGLDAAIAESPQNDTLYLERANTLIEHEDYAQALSDLKILDAIAPKRSERHYLRGKVYLAQGKNLDAVKSLNALIETNAKDAEPYHLRSYAYRNLGNMPAALEDARRAIELNTSAPIGDYLYVVELLLAGEQKDAVVQMFHHAEQALGALPTLLFAKADAFKELSEYEAAAAVYERLRSENPALSFQCWLRESELWDGRNRDKTLHALAAVKSEWQSMSKRQQSALSDSYADVLSREAKLQSGVN